MRRADIRRSEYRISQLPNQAVSIGSSDQKNGVKFDQEFRSEERRRQIRAGEDFRQAGVSRLGKVELGFRSGDSRPLYIDTGAPWLRGQVQFVSEKCSTSQSQQCL